MKLKLRGSIANAVILLTVFILTISVPASFIACSGGTPDTLATVYRTAGQVYVQRSGTTTWVSVTPGTELKLGDHIRTRANSTATITFFEGSVMEMQEETEISLEVMEKEGKSSTVKLKQSIGVTSSRVEKLIDAKSRYEVETAVGSALVRGSIMGVTVWDDGTTIVDAIQGQCWAVAQGTTVLLTQGMRSIIFQGSPPSSPAPPSSGTISPPSIAGIAPAFFTIEPPLPKQIYSPPMVLTLPAEDYTTISLSPGWVRLNGTLTTLGTAPQAKVSFEWGTRPGVFPYETGPQVMSSTGNYYYDLDLSLLSFPPSKICYRAKADAGIHGLTYGVEKTYTIPVAPTVTTDSAVDRYSDPLLPPGLTALYGTLVDMGSASSVIVSFEWGTSPGVYTYETVPQTMTSTGIFLFILDVYTHYLLTNDYTFYIRAKANGGSAGTSYGAEIVYIFPN